MFDIFSSEFKTILKASSFLGLRSSFCTSGLVAYCSLRKEMGGNEMERNEMGRNDMKICSLRNENL